MLMGLAVTGQSELSVSAGNIYIVADIARYSSHCPGHNTTLRATWLTCSECMSAISGIDIVDEDAKFSRAKVNLVQTTLLGLLLCTLVTGILQIT